MGVILVIPKRSGAIESLDAVLRSLDGRIFDKAVPRPSQAEALTLALDALIHIQ